MGPTKGIFSRPRGDQRQLLRSENEIPISFHSPIRGNIAFKFHGSWWYTQIDNFSLENNDHGRNWPFLTYWHERSVIQQTSTSHKMYTWAIRVSHNYHLSQSSEPVPLSCQFRSMEVHYERPCRQVAMHWVCKWSCHQHMSLVSLPVFLA